ncbi:MAG: hypothetical protein ACLUZ6_06235 [Lachnospira eligens]
MHPIMAMRRTCLYGWSAVAVCNRSNAYLHRCIDGSHLSAFRDSANMRSKLMRHMRTLQLGFMDEEGSGKVRRIVNESSAATETYIAHQLLTNVLQQPHQSGFVLLLLVFDWRLGLLCLIPGCNRICSNELHDGRQHEKENGRVPECIGGNVEARQLSM